MAKTMKFKDLPDVSFFVIVAEIKGKGSCYLYEKTNDLVVNQCHISESYLLIHNSIPPPNPEEKVLLIDVG